jgi:hypothetical protein
LDTLDATEDWTPWVISPLHALDGWLHVELDMDSWDLIRTGRRIAQHEPADDGVLACGVVESKLSALLRAEAGQWVPHKVFLAADSH